MYLKPKKTKFNKFHKGRVKGISTNNNKLCFGDYGIKTITLSRIHNYQIEAARQVLVRKLRRKVDKVWIRIFPNIGITSKSTKVRMGKGKGSIVSWISRVKKNEMIFEFTALSIKHAYNASKAVSHKLPCKVIFIKKEKENDSIIK